MSTIRKTKILFWISFLCEVISTATFLWMPLVGENKTGQILTGIIFWIFLICGYVCIGIANHLRKMHQKPLRAKQRMGLFKFFSNVPAAIFDTVLAAALVLAIITAFTKLKETYLPYPLLFLILLSLNAHCMFNGSVYIFANFKPIKGDENHG